VTLLKDAQVAASTVAGPDATFAVTLTGLSAGNYTFSVYGEDKDGNRSSLQTFPVSVTSGATTDVGGIFLAPTLALDKSEVKQGDNLAIFGQSAVNADVTIQINSDQQLFAKTKSDASGVYLYNLDTATLDYGGHTTKSKGAVANEISSFSAAVPFTVGTKNVAATAPKVAAKGDLNGDKKVNLIDFSVMAYWYGRPLTAAGAKADLDHDGKVDLVDFSILAYYWTG